MTCVIDERSPSKYIGVPTTILEKVAFNKHPLKGKCLKSTMACGYHRVGLVPVYSTVDNGAAGNACQEICLDCGKRFFGANHTGFILRNQPSGFREGIK